MTNIFKGIPDDLSEEIFDEIVKNDNVSIERIISKGHKSPDKFWYDQERHEWVIILKGEAKLEFEGGPIIHLVSGDYYNIPAHQKHRVAWTKENIETVWLAVFY
ncbi:cupin domain-containing protein [Shewanella sp. 202IG2-18]|uniref:cupin domain-containing protein n=1 Tax=Parashewanella hymeniacidonis TaxID=2807618 RepID=UPI001960E783|nr:cupin domain-containing protein [Parashewanella hymeniacidonis]MBM7072324.1 cupin domain-containing protein [Parashewanella hymeniacidonis]